MKKLFTPLLTVSATMLFTALCAQQVVIDDSAVSALAADHDLIELPEKEQNAMLDYCMPNPVSSSCSVNYIVPNDATISHLIVQSAQGNVIFMSEPLPPGKGLYRLPVENLPDGHYYYTLTVDYAKIETRSMLIAH